ncbi:MAG TPA: DUF4893 domain-containing protein [Pelagibacterium sp.]|uniref:DUF4893 domain-containing protein n=1 Tax=Pelagibacterium sp. TaxID=1967288 RepID=UPI002C889F4F|nr:DUF4893 domain-containing protein [Pelagibacterium sp.]HWJ88813.1 DUF4893 domain-containing protein [Pelagibacterium sp.]
MRPLVVAIALLALALPAAAQNEAKALFGKLYPEDQVLASGWREQLSALLDQLEATSDDPETRAALPQFRELIAARPLPYSIDELLGDWQMRSLQASDLGAFPYTYFPARIYRDGERIVFDKASGSQRHLGVLAQRDDEMVFFVGALYYGYEAPRAYSALTASDSEVTPEQREFDAVAEIYKTGDQTFLMAFAPEGGRFRFYEIRK